MDEQLKRRLLGAGVIMLFAVIVVPLFFEDKTPKDPDALPQQLDQKALDLPKNQSGKQNPPGDGVSVAKTPGTSSRDKPGYDVVPLDESSTKSPKADSEVASPSADDKSENNRPANEAHDSGSANYPPEEGETSRPDTESSAASPHATPRNKSRIAPPARAATTGHARQQHQNRPGHDTQPSRRLDAHGDSKKPDKKSAAASVASPKTQSGQSHNQTAQSRKPAPVKPAKSGATPSARAPAPAKTGARPTVSGTNAKWTVQAGSYTDESSAKSMAEKLKKKKIPARVSAVEGSSGKVYRVVVGSNLGHKHAEKVQKQISSQGGVKGEMVQHH